MSEFKIPKRIQLMCHPVDIVFERDIIAKDDQQGQARYRINQIAIQEATDSFPIPPEHHVETYFHELLHWVFFLLEENELRENEALIEKMSRLLAQAALSAEYK